METSREENCTTNAQPQKKSGDAMCGEAQYFMRRKTSVGKKISKRQVIESPIELLESV